MRFELGGVAFDHRAVSVDEAAGFERLETYPQVTNDGACEFVRTGRRASPARRSQ